jgi:bacteriocin-like protein
VKIKCRGTKLNEEELQKVSGGKVTFQDFPYVKKGG